MHPRPPGAVLTLVKERRRSVSRDGRVFGVVALLGALALFLWSFNGLALYAIATNEPCTRGTCDEALWCGPISWASVISIIPVVWIFGGIAGWWAGGRRFVARAERAITALIVLGFLAIMAPGVAISVRY